MVGALNRPIRPIDDLLAGLYASGSNLTGHMTLPDSLLLPSFEIIECLAEEPESNFQMLVVESPGVHPRFHLKGFLAQNVAGVFPRIELMNRCPGGFRT
jgi:hypothetical protein